MDLATILGIVISFGLVLAGILEGGSIMIFVSIPSLLIVVGGTIGATLVNYPLATVLGVMGVIKKTFNASAQSPSSIIEQFMDFANRARREGILSLEPVIKEVEDAYLRKGLQLTVDGLEPQAIQEILETEISSLESRHETGVEIINAMGAYAPALGMIGTVIGLVQMLQTMSDPSSIGPAMAVALITTFYGAVLANLVFIPMAGKLKMRSREEVTMREMQMEGILAISRGENPRIIQEKLSSYQPPKERKADAG
ncbi:MotA/TolQ/ExbB proton channel [Oleidesulfovibrio alaskensis G20]|jgi:chemotaxis protein MotA|uniref:MotA/TolQ/ExbB proton channel n=1 Tax=Oleidesulfovibrio alaskensis (strain ATCC BAA-1058 / DSM 17464 / G20) TaxID=207559 RepID=Q30VB4_OLEA2|nr:flagellar motor protein [Oleidesulfovibrio alaskensis]ABB40382.1 MotA/TolQ/ExbB proton channel [Oleidesulfovibrio alaskensis G20]MBG0772648.1 flagellar motor protein [Oleidesulfovibrio alaskensis]MBL3581921.1 flagellar motor protein [Oleidesulfovibrio alaskensis]